ncbi:MAG TPA: glycosyltransferase [Actinocrinis sp.]|uniref:glycosyltransferase n=1 Tax=Actinocrinis sp. TaxID=1920516 RepID=UPI002DDCFBD3|nr:glycosyltransferase [Actinocrinis sp.]HEV2346435.1 glycosyltransferase [Actinocrinis sp.]
MHQHPEFGAAAIDYGNSRTQARLLGNAASATYTTCASSRIAEVFAQFCDNVVVVPNGLPAKYLDRPARWMLDEKSIQKPIVGWAGSSFTQWELTTNVKDALSRVDEWGGKLHVVGVPYPIMRKTGLVKPGVSVTGWVDGTANYLDTIDFDIWVAPYRKSDYNDAKVPTKALEAAFLGIPIVASATTPYRGFVKDGVTGFLVEPGGDWETPIRELINNPGLRESMGRAAREVAVEFTIEKLAAQLWDPILFGERT